MVTTLVMNQYLHNSSSIDGGGEIQNSRDYSSLSSSSAINPQQQHCDVQADDAATMVVATSTAIVVTSTTPTTTEPEVDPVRSTVGTNSKGHHFYYLPPLHHDVHLTEARHHDDGIRDEICFGDRRRLHDSTFPLDQPPQFPSSPMVTPPTRKHPVTRTTAPSSSNHATMTDMAKYSHKKLNRVVKKAPPQSLYCHPVDGVPHVYHDYSQIPYDDGGYIRKKTGGVTQPFPEKLQEMLAAVEGTGEKNIVSWLPHGRAFLVRKPKEFTDVIVPKYFKQTKITSFQRQLNLYGFRRLTQGPDAGAYYHELFLQIRPGLCQRMIRQKVKGTGHKQPADAKTEPNFYEMPLTTNAVPLPPQSPTPFEQDSVQQHYLEQFEGNSSQEQLTQQQQQYIDMPAPLSRPPFEMTPVNDTRSEVDTTISHSSTWRYSHLHADADSVMDSPASPGLHGAAHLLQGIASGYIHNNLGMPTGDALPSDVARSSIQDNEASLGKLNDEGRRPASFLKPRISNDDYR